MPPSQPASTRAFIIEIDEAPRIRVFGLSPAERLRRTLHAAGVRAVAIASEPPSLVARGGDRALLFRADWIYDERLVCALVEADDSLLLRPGGDGSLEPVAAHVDAQRVADAHRALLGGPGADALRAVTPDQLAPAYNPALRKLDPPLLLPAREDRVREVEERLFAASYKGLTDLITRWLWPVPALAAVRALARRGVTPNAVTAASWVLAVLTMGLFWIGSFGPGLVCAWLMTFLDTVDGKLARVTLASSRFGHAFDHGLDLLHPPFWYAAWAVGLGASTAGVQALAWVVVGGYLLGRLLEGLFLLFFRFECHCWRPIDGAVRTITARRNPNLILLSVGTAGGRPDLGFAMVAIWTAISISFHLLQLGQAVAARRRGGAVRPWDEAQGSGEPAGWDAQPDSARAGSVA